MKGAQGKLVKKPRQADSNSGNVGKVNGANITKSIIGGSAVKWDLDNYSTVKRGGMYHGYSRSAAESITSKIINDGK